MGCASKPQTEPAPVRGPISQINLLTIPVALNFDDAPGPDGFAARVYAGNRASPKALPITSGTLELLMFDGMLRGTNPDKAKPLRVWSFPAADLPKFLNKTSIGTGYRFTPLWGNAKPTQDKISIVARYLTPHGTKLYSAPTVISVSVH